MKEVRIHWLDARSEDGWIEQEELDICAAKITTIGYLIDETEEVVCIANSKEEKTSQLSGIIIIPKVCILTQQNIGKEQET
jgi:hypothetical protein